MKANQFRAMLRNKPFQPFVVRTSSGESYSVGHLEVVWMSPDGEVVLVYDKKKGVSLIDTDHISKCVREPGKTRNRKRTDG